MRDFRSILKRSVILAAALALVALTLALSGPGGGPANSMLRLWLQLHVLDARQPGTVMVLRLPQPVKTAAPGGTDVWTPLARLGVEQGDTLGDGALLVRVPDGSLAAAQRVAGGSLQAYSPSSRLAPSLTGSEQAQGQEGLLPVDVTVFEPADKASVIRAVRSLGGAVLRGEAEAGRVLRLRLAGAGVQELSRLPAIVYIEPTQDYRLMNDRARDLVAAAPLAADGFLDSSRPGLAGAGQIIGLADSGLDTGSTEDIHPDLASTPGQIPKVVMLKSWAGAATAADPNGHGTHMAATIAGTGAASSGRYKGLAPEASIYFQGLVNSDGKLDPPPDLTALFDPAYAAGVRIHVNGWGGETGGYLSTASQTDRFARAHPDFLAVFSSGNNGLGSGGLTPEAYTKNGLVVGASQSPHPVFNSRQADGRQACDFSSRGPTSDGRVKPDLLAPGALISARARRVASEFDLGDSYTYMEGTSMAAAVAGGSAALLREYLTKYEQVLKPSAALLRAALICGARTQEAGPGGGGFGILDLGGTVLALHEKAFQFVDSAAGVAGQETATYTCQVSSGSAPFKATLAWTDPPAAPGAARPLVNNLDLVVLDPAGKTWTGNSFLTSGRPDEVNNVEQVFIPQPVPGAYTIFVKGTNIAQNTVSDAPHKSQDFALVFGQPLIRDVVQSVSQQVNLASGAAISLANARIGFERDGKAVAWPQEAGAGAGSVQNPLQASRDGAGMDIYLPPAATGSPSYAYLAGRTWQAGGVQLIDTGGGPLFTEINPGARSGGFFIAPYARSRLRVNGSQLGDTSALLPGGEITAAINPSTQTIWAAEVVFQTTEGFLERIDLQRRELFLIGRQEALRLAPQAALAYLDEITDADQADLPFGAGAKPAWDKLLPGLRLKLMLSPGDGDVIYVGACRQLAVGTITGVDAAAGEITLGGGRAYKVGLGVSLQLDEKNVTLAALSPGQHAIAVLFPENREVLALSAYSQAYYGRVVYVSAKQQLLYLVDEYRNFHIVHLSDDTQLFRWGLPVAMNTVEPGCWARLYLAPETGLAGRLDLAETAPESTGIFESYDQSEQRLSTDQGSYRLTDRTLVTKNGYLVAPGDLVDGEEVTVSPLLAHDGGRPLLAAVAARTYPGVSPPRLDVAAPWRDDYVTLSGITSADRLYLYLAGSGRKVVPVERGKRFTYVFQAPGEASSNTPAAEGGQSGGQDLAVQLVAVDTRTGGVAGQSINIPARAGAGFKDLEGHWAEADVDALLVQHLIRGYPDNTFKPGAPITRAEFVVLLAGALGWSGAGDSLTFSDAGQIPEWARLAVGRGLHQGQIRGYPDNTFKPGAPITRAEAGVLLDQALQYYAPDTGASGHDHQPPWDDWQDIPGWAQAPAVRLFNDGILTGRTTLAFAPLAPLKRGETAAVITRLLEYLRENA